MWPKFDPKMVLSVAEGAKRLVGHARMVNLNRNRNNHITKDNMNLTANAINTSTNDSSSNNRCDNNM